MPFIVSYLLDATYDICYILWLYITGCIKNYDPYTCPIPSGLPQLKKFKHDIGAFLP